LERENLAREILRPLGPLFDNDQPGFAAVAKELGIQLVYIDAAGAFPFGEHLASAGVPYVIAWHNTVPPAALSSMQFARSFFAALRNPTVTLSEAFALSVHLTHAFAGHSAGPNAPVEPAMPRFIASQPPVLPSSASVPSPVGYDTHKKPLYETVPGYAEVRLCAPHAELRLLLTALFGIMSATCLGHLCQAMRGLIVAEVRQLQVMSSTTVVKPQLLLPAGCSALRCKVRTASGGTTTVLLGAPANIAAQPAILEHVLRQTLTADAQALQLKLPPPGTPLPPIQSSRAIACNAPLVEALAVTSVWTINLLRSLARDPGCRVLVASGVGAVSATPVAAFTVADAHRFEAVVTGNDPLKLVAKPPQVTDTMLSGAAFEMAAVLQGPMAPHVAPAATAAARATVTVNNHANNGVAHQAAAAPLPPPTAVGLQAPARPSSPPPPLDGVENGASEPPSGSGAGITTAEPWRSNRPPLMECTEADFLTDLKQFLMLRQGREIASSDTFPDMTINGVPLDAFAMYTTVCSAGGYRSERVDWMRGVFAAMQNSKAGDGGDEIMGDANVLKRHYKLLLLGYEDANAWRDVVGVEVGVGEQQQQQQQLLQEQVRSGSKGGQAVNQEESKREAMEIE
jgi:hypothetical protein